MKRRNGLVKACMIGAMLSSVALAVPGMQAQAGDLLVKAPAAAEPVPYWWFHGEVEAGGRFFLNNPQRNGSAYLGQPSLAKFYEYRDLRPGPFGNIWLATGSSDGLYQIDVGGKNIGYNDQHFYLDASKAGEHYFSAVWDQTPHLYSTSAQTPYLGVGTTNLTLPPGMLKPFGTIIPNSSIINPYLQQTDLGIKRDTASVQYRWTPTDAWDIKADLSHMRRTGTQVEGVVGFGPLTGATVASGFNPTQVPRPVADTTQNYGLNGEYAGTSPWNQKFTFKLAYNGSQYSDDFSSYTVQNPFCSNTGACPDFYSSNVATGFESPFARLSTWPSNNANAFSGTLGADLPWKSRYVGTLSYTMMRQNDAFIPMSYQVPAFPLPASSLNGAINTLLSNNVVTTKITPELTNKLSYRYYNFDNQTPQILFPCTAPVTTNCTTAWIAYDQDHASEKQIQSLSMQYVKQNAGEALTWRPTHAWNLGAQYGYERYDWTQADVSATNEHSGKLFADWKPTSWFGVRSSGYYSSRRYENYDYVNNVGNIQFPNTTLAGNGFFYSPAYRQMMIDNRNRWKANFAVDVLVLPGVTVTPTFKYQDDNYGLDPATNMGLRDSRSWNGGVDVTFVVDPRTSIMFGYLREYYTQLLYGINSTNNANTPANTVRIQTNDLTTVDTFTAVARYAAIPDKLDLALRYTASHGVDHQQMLFSDGSLPAGGQFPDMTTWFQRLDTTAVYTFDKAAVAQAGLTGVVKAKLHYAWERNAVANWSNDPLAPYSPLVSTTAIWMAYNNPNYNVHLLSASLAYTW